MHHDYIELLNTKGQNYFAFPRTLFLQQTSSLFSYWILVHSVFGFSWIDVDEIHSQSPFRTSAQQ